MTIDPNGIYIVSARRTPIGAFLGSLSTLTAPKLGAAAITAALADTGLSGASVDRVYMGNVLQAGIGQAPARQAALAAGLPDQVPTVTVNKVCGSGLEAVLAGARAIRLGEAEIVVSGGMESMSQAPYYSLGARTGLRMGNQTLVDGMLHDGLVDPYQNKPMGLFGEVCAEEYDLSRSAQDEFASSSYKKALAAMQSGALSAEIVPVTVPGPKGTSSVVSEDEEPGRGKPEKFASLKPAFKPDGTITAANASSVNDGAAALVLASGRAVLERNLKPLARLEAWTEVAGPPSKFTTAPATAIKALFEKTGETAASIDLFEINEAFSCVPMACARLAGLDLEKVNVDGGAVAFGHPIGASGARILTTLVHGLRRRQVKKGIAAICIGGGEAIAAYVSSM